MLLFFETPSRQRLKTNVPPDTQINELIAELYEELNWSATDSGGTGVRAVVEIVDPDNPDRTKRLRADQTVKDAGLYDGATIRVSPEAVAGVVDERVRLRALQDDLRNMEDLADWNPEISFEARPENAPTRYTVTFHCKGFTGLRPDGRTPELGETHQVEIVLGADYPRVAPQVRWLTPIFHPNIHPGTGKVCLGVLDKQYMPGLGLARLVTMLLEIVQYRNFDQFEVFNADAGRWAVHPESWPYIEAIGGIPYQGAIGELMDALKGKSKRTERQRRFEFTRVRRRTPSS